MTIPYHTKAASFGWPIPGHPFPMESLPDADADDNQLDPSCCLCMRNQVVSFIEFWWWGIFLPCYNPFFYRMHHFEMMKIHENPYNSFIFFPTSFSHWTFRRWRLKHCHVCLELLGFVLPVPFPQPSWFTCKSGRWIALRRCQGESDGILIFLYFTNCPTKEKKAKTSIQVVERLFLVKRFFWVSQPIFMRSNIDILCS